MAPFGIASPGREPEKSSKDGLNIRRDGGSALANRLRRQGQGYPLQGTIELQDRPLHVRGRVYARTPAPLAVALNGRIAATTTPFLERGATVFHTMIPEDAVSAGANDVATFVIDRSAGAVTLVTTRSRQ